MTGHDIFAALGEIDKKFVIESAPERRKRGIITKALKRSLIAACLCILLCGASATALIASGNIPLDSFAVITADEIGKIMQTNTMSESTNTYKVIEVKSSEELKIFPIPEGEYLPIYETKLSELDEEELLMLAEYIIPKFEELFGFELETDGVHRQENFHPSVYLTYRSEKGKWNDPRLEVKIDQRKDFYSIVIDYSVNGKNAPKLKLGESELISNESMTAEEKFAMHSAVRDVFCEIFEIDLPHYADRTRGSYFYNGVTHPSENYSTEYAKDYYNYDNYLTLYGGIGHENRVSISLKLYRKSIDDFCPAVMQAKKITLEEAEELLYKGYVFGGHTCTACMAEQDKIDFEGYDYVGLEYVFGKERAYDTIGVPFYVFFKLIDSTEYEDFTVYQYAKTYVPAIKVRGLDRYFRLQSEKHKSAVE